MSCVHDISHLNLRYIYLGDAREGRGLGPTRAGDAAGGPRTRGGTRPRTRWRCSLAPKSIRNGVVDKNDIVLSFTVSWRRKSYGLWRRHFFHRFTEFIGRLRCNMTSKLR